MTDIHLDHAADPGDHAIAAGRRRRRALLLLAVGAVLLLAVGVSAGALVRSPAQQVADTAPPPCTVITAAVEQRVLADTVILRGQVSAGTTVEATPAPSGVDRVIVTAVRVAPGDEVGPGAVLLEISGRPLLVLPGAVPAYRDLRPGMRGADVEQLQEAMFALGHLTGPPDGDFGPGTKAAVAAFYQEIGYEAPTTGDPGVLTAANAAVRQAERELLLATEALKRIREAPPDSAPGEPDPVAEAERRLHFAREDLNAAVAARDEVARTTGAMLPLSEVVFVPEFPARVERMTAVVGLDLTAGEQGGPLITVSSGELVVRAHLTPAQRELLAEGMPVEIVSELEGVRAEGEIAGIGELSADATTGVRGHALTVMPTGGEFDERLAGGDVRLTVEAATTGEEVLVVPLSAVFTDASGGVVVMRLDADGSQVRTPVAPGVSGDGYVAVDPLDRALTPGDQVVIGATGCELRS